MIQKNKGIQDDNSFQYYIKKIDIYGESLNWYIGNNEKYQTITGGIKTAIVILISMIFLFYSLIKLFIDRNGSFVMYDITYPELNNASFIYFNDFEIFFFFQSSSYKMIELDSNIFQAYLVQINGEDKSYMSQYSFEECDNDYFIETLGFSKSFKEALDKTYCINKSKYGNNDIEFSLAQVNPLGYTTNSVLFLLVQTCSDSTCSDEENQNFQNALNSIEEVKIFVKSYTPNPLKMNNPLQREVITFTLKNNFRGATLYYKNYNMTTQSHIIPYLFKKNKTNFLAYDYYSTGENDNSNSEIDYSHTYYLEFFLSTKVSFLERNYEQIHTTLANFVGVFNSLQAIGRIFSFLFDSFSKEFFIFNFIIKDKLFIKKRRKSSYIANPPPKIYSISNNNLLNNNNKEGEELNINNNEFQKRDKSTLTKDNLFTEEYLNEKNKKSITDKESKDIILANQEEKNKKDYGKVEGIQINILKTFWLYILNALEKEESKYPDIQNALIKLKLIQGFFDTSTYLNLIFDVMRLKKVIFNKEQLKLFESIHFTEEDIMQHFDKLQSSGDAFEDKSIYEIIQRSKRTKNSKLTDNIIKY